MSFFYIIVFDMMFIVIITNIRNIEQRRIQIGNLLPIPAVTSWVDGITIRVTL